MLRAAATPAVARLLNASAVAVILPSSGSSNATGQITHTTALPVQPTGTVTVFLPAGVVTAGSQGTGAGLYQATYSSTTVCQLTGTGIVTANAAYTQVITEVALALDTIPGGSMGISGGSYFRARYTRINNANAHTERIRFGGLTGSIAAGTSAASTGIIQLEGEVRNRGSAALQLVGGLLGAGFIASGAAWVTDTKDTTAAVDIAYTGQLTAATDFLILESRETWLLP